MRPCSRILTSLSLCSGQPSHRNARLPGSLPSPQASTLLTLVPASAYPLSAPGVAPALTGCTCPTTGRPRPTVCHDVALGESKLMYIPLCSPGTGLRVSRPIHSFPLFVVTGKQPAFVLSTWDSRLSGVCAVGLIPERLLFGQGRIRFALICLYWHCCGGAHDIQLSVAE